MVAYSSYKAELISANNAEDHNFQVIERINSLFLERTLFFEQVLTPICILVTLLYLIAEYYRLYKTVFIWVIV